MEDPRTYPKERRARLPPNSGEAQTIVGRAAAATEPGQTLRTVFKKSGVKNAHSHRFGHTLATRLLEEGATFEQVADILGNSPAIVGKHYGKWSKGRQNNIDRLMFAPLRRCRIQFQSQKSHTKKWGL